MNQEDFERKSKEPVDLDACNDALQRLINREHTLHIPARPDDEDMLLSRALRELGELREVNEAMKRYIKNGIELGYIDDREGDYKKYI